MVIFLICLKGRRVFCLSVYFPKHISNIKKGSDLKVKRLSPLRKHTYSTIFKILQSKQENFQIQNSDIFHISAQNIDCGYSLEPPRRGGSNEYPQTMFLCKNKKNNLYLCKPQLYYIKVGFKVVKIIKVCFRDANVWKCVEARETSMQVQ